MAPASHSADVQLPEYDTQPMYWSLFCFLNSSKLGPGVMVGSEVAADGVTKAAKLPVKSTDAARAFACLLDIFV